MAAIRTVRVVSFQHDQPPSVNPLNFILTIVCLVNCASGVEVCFLNVNSILLHDAVYTRSSREILFECIAFVEKVREFVLRDDLRVDLAEEENQRAKVGPDA